MQQEITDTFQTEDGGTVKVVNAGYSEVPTKLETSVVIRFQ